MREDILGPKLRYSWQQALFDALIEYNRDRMRDKIAEAERATTGRLLERPTDPDELLALRDAWLALRTLFRQSKPELESADEKEDLYGRAGRRQGGTK